MDTTKRTLRVLEWNTILEQLSKLASSEIGKERCLNLSFYNDPIKIKKELALTSQAKLLYESNLHPPLGGIRNIVDFLNIARTGQILKSLELIDVANTIGASRRLKSFFARYKEEVEDLFEIGKKLYENKELEESVLNIFDNDGSMLDTASSELKRLRNSQKDQLNNLKTRLNNFINSQKISKYLQEPVFTIRNDRYVVPVRAEYKVNVPGIVHDSSASGVTLFIEPKSIVELNNALKETELKIDYEVKRILAELSFNIKSEAIEITNSLDTLAYIDFVCAKARYSIETNATEPELNNEKFISLKNARHPLLMKVVKEVVPNNIELGKNWNTLIITGANTGGKTVTLKTTGLSVLMTKAGMHVPADEANIYPFKTIFADIGDEQSVIQSLSTFSSHLTNIINILEQADNNSLVLLDELGAGTDPSEGSSLAQAILETLNTRETRTIITTHYGELKALAYTKTGFHNASVEFNTETLAPTYKLLLGIPGTSNAITIALNLGLENKIAQKAQEIYLNQKDSTSKVMEGLQNTQQELSENSRIVAETKKELELLEKDYNEKIEKLTEEKKKTINIYKKKFETELFKARSEIKEIMEEIRRTKSEKISRKAYSKLQEIESGTRSFTSTEIGEIEPEFEELNWNEVQIGDIILLKDLKKEAEVLALPDKNKNVQIQMGSMKTTVKTDKIAKFTGKIYKKPQKTYNKTGFSISRSDVSNTLDLRGARVEDGLSRLEVYLDKASLANLSPVYIIHGHGTGALREAVRDYLNTSPYVAKYRAGERAEGGDGVSVVELN